MSVVWLFGDNRYILPLLPPAIALIAARNMSVQWKLGIPFLAVLVLASLVGLRDHLKFNAAVWDGVGHLLRQGVPSREINGGYAVNGWLQYAHPEEARRDPNGGVLVNRINQKNLPSRYQVCNRIVPGWTVIETIPYTRWASPSGSVYVLERSN
jgi:hypothetical protein